MPARFFAFLSVAVALLNMGLKFGAYRLTGSIGLLSDAAESTVNLVAALVATWALSFAAQPPDAEHRFGHSKAEYFSSGAEGILILVAAGSIVVTAWDRLWHPHPLEQIGIGLALSIVASVLNGGLALVLFRAGKRLRSITLRADAHHLLTDVWTSVGVVVALLLVPLTGWLILDPLIAIGVALNIVWTGIRLLRETGSGLLDASLPAEDLDVIRRVLEPYEQQGFQFHALRTRSAASRRFISMHVLVPGAWTVKQGHDLCEDIELALIHALPGSHVESHLEPLEDPASWADAMLDRNE